jgi:CelD/BcsL family acetyltransferase involved in cellulose biosynthesis
MMIDTDDTTPLSVVTLDPCRDRAWDDLVDLAGGSLFASPPWLRAIETTYALPISAAGTARTTGHQPLVAGMVACRIDDALGVRLIGTPFCDFCDLLGDTSNEALGPVLGQLIASGSPIKLRLLDPPAWLGTLGLRTVAEDHWHGVGLDRSVDEMWSSLGSTGRRNVKKAGSSGVTVRFDDSMAAVDTFFDLHLATRRAKHRLLAQPRAFFHRIWEEFHPIQAISVALAEADREPLAGIFLLTWNGRTYYKFNASNPSALATRPNDLLMWESMKWARDRGSALLDLGLSDADQAGLVRYKRKFATEEGRIATLVGGPDKPPQATQLLEALGQVTAALTDERVPGDVAERVSDALYRYFT